MSDYVAEAKEIERDLFAWRRDLHRHPELGFAEVRTAGIIARHLSELGLKVQTGVGRTGVVGLLEGTSPLSPKGTGGPRGGQSSCCALTWMRCRLRKKTRPTIFRKRPASCTLAATTAM